MRIPRALGALAIGIVGAAWVLGVAYPLLTVLLRARNLGLLLDPSIQHVAGVTALQSVVSAAISSLIGLPLGLWAGARLRPTNRWAQTFLAIPSGVPSIVAAFAWIFWLGRSGWLADHGVALDWAYSLKAVILAHVFYNAPWIALLVAQARGRVPERELEAARTLGAGRRARLRLVLYPRVKFAFYGAVAQALAFCAMSFALVMILGGGPPVQTLETALYSRIRFGSLDLSGALACGIWELLLTLPPWAAVLALRAREETRLVPGQATIAPNSIPGSVFLLLASFLFAAPYLVVVGGARGNFPPEAAASLFVSIRLAICTGLGATILSGLSVIALASLPAKPRAISSVLLLLPAGVSAMVLGLGIWLAYGRYVDPFSGSFGAMAALQTALFFPIAFRILWPLAQEFPSGAFEAALTLGASPWRAFRHVDWPRWRAPVLAAFVIVAAASLGEIAAVSLFASENLIPLPLLLSRWMAQYRFAEAEGVAALLFCLSAFTIILGTGLLRSPQSRSARVANPRPV